MASLMGSCGVASSSSSSFMGSGDSRKCLLAPGIVRLSSSSSSSRRSSCIVEAKIREISMPVLSSTMTEGKVVSWSKSEGDKVAKGDKVVVVESDKADMEVEAFYDGYLAHIVVAEGESVPIGATIAFLAESEEEIPQAKAAAAAASSSSPKAEPIAPPPPPPPVAIDGARPAAAAASVETVKSGRLVATPYAKKLAKEYKVDIAKVGGTGPYGRIVAADVELAAGKTSKQPVATATLQTVASSILAAEPAVKTGGAPERKPLDGALVSLKDDIVPFTGMQAAVSKNMVESLSVPTFRVGYTITTNALDILYKKIKSKGVTMSALLAKATALALVQHPLVNASCKDGKSFSYNSSINIAVAVATDGGLITPVLQDADKMDIYSLSRRWKELVEKARAKQLQPSEYTTGTFTISNLGMFGVDRFDAILPPGQGAIMAVGASRATVVAAGAGAFNVKSQMQVNVTADHRIIYGADLAAFLQTLAKIIEDPKDLTL